MKSSLEFHFLLLPSNVLFTPLLPDSIKESLQVRRDQNTSWEILQYKKFQRNRPQEHSPKNSNSPGRILLVVLQAFVFLVFGVAIFILAPAVIFFFFEDDWEFVDCVYFAFITLSTIGFGDLVAGNYTFLKVYQQYFLHNNFRFRQRHQPKVSDDRHCQDNLRGVCYRLDHLRPGLHHRGP